MEVCAQPGMASDSPGDVSNKMTETQTAGLAFQVKSGWTAVVLLTRSVDAPQLADVTESSCLIRDFLKRDSRVTRSTPE